MARTAKETMEALNKRVNSKLAVQNPSTIPEQPGAPTYIKYTPSQQVGVVGVDNSLLVPGCFCVELVAVCAALG